MRPLTRLLQQYFPPWRLPEPRPAPDASSLPPPPLPPPRRLWWSQPHHCRGFPQLSRRYTLSHHPRERDPHGCNCRGVGFPPVSFGHILPRVDQTHAVGGLTVSHPQGRDDGKSRGGSRRPGIRGSIHASPGPLHGKGAHVSRSLHFWREEGRFHHAVISSEDNFTRHELDAALRKCVVPGSWLLGGDIQRARRRCGVRGSSSGRRHN